MTQALEPCDYHAIAIELRELASGERTQLSPSAEIENLDFELGTPWDGQSVECAACAGLPAVHFEYRVTEEEYANFCTWEYLARRLAGQRELALNEDEELGPEPINPTPDEQVARVRRLLQDSAEYFHQDFGSSLFVLAATLGDKETFAVMENQSLGRGRDLSVLSAHHTLKEARNAIRLIGTHDIESIGIEELNLLENV